MPENEIREAYITKYALTKGIIKMDVIPSKSSDLVTDAKHKYQYFRKGEYFYDKFEAITKAKEMQAKKIISLTKSLDKIKKLDFSKVKI